MDGELTDSLAFVVHELRSPLGYMATAAHLLLEESVDESVRARCHVIERTAQRMIRTSEAILATTRLIRTADTSRIYAPALIARGLADHAAAAGVTLRLEEDQASSVARCLGQPHLLEALLHCLLQNAVDHGAEGMGVLVSISSTAEEVRLRVENSMSASRGHAGTGLGLVLCARLAEIIGAALETGITDGNYRATVRLARLDPGSVARSPHRALLPAPQGLHPAGAVSF